MLLNKCICGSERYEELILNGQRLARCECGVVRSMTMETAEQYEQQYFSGAYHSSSDRHPGCVPYAERYAHDRNVAELRWNRHNSVLNGKISGVFHALDVGCANGAFVDALLGHGIDSWGIDLNVIQRHVRYAEGTVRNLPVYMPDEFQLVTYHDVLEHIIDPGDELVAAWKIITSGGALVVDVPDIADAAGLHHVKPEHLWYFTADALADLIEDSGFKVLSLDTPLPGKMVMYAEAR